MSDQEQTESSITEEFRILGKNLVDAVHTAWDSPARTRLQGEIERGLSEFQNSVSEEIEHWSESPTAQRMKSDVRDAADRVRSSEVEKSIRQELITALKSINTELEKVSSRWSAAEKNSEPEGSAATSEGPEAEK
jgi:hypothetical protein